MEGHHSLMTDFLQENLIESGLIDKPISRDGEMKIVLMDIVRDGQHGENAQFLDTGVIQELIDFRCITHLTLP